MKKVVVLALFLVGVLPTVALTADTIARFQGGIGVLPVSNAAGTANADGTFPNVTRNVVRGVNPGGQPWVIADLNAVVKADGSIKVDGRGLLLAGGNNIGFTAGLSVFATLICGPVPNGPFTQHSSNDAGVALDAAGDFRIDDFLSTMPPMTCANPVLLIRNTAGGAANGVWFAAGIPKLP
jgi:hypothetical protein